ncbi:MAG: type II secretion system protein [bacterium]|nr:type II secretion system protein [bacterium]
MKNPQYSTFDISRPTSRGFTRQNFSKKNLGGFTLVEMIVALGLFTIVLFIATSAFLSIVNADRKARAVRVAADNLNIALEDMSRRIKTGTSYYCGPGGDALLSVKDCASGGNTLFFTGQDGFRTMYTLDSSGAILRSIAPDAPISATSPEIKITSLNFIVNGSDPTDKIQPVVAISISGSLSAGTANTTFKMQTTVTQRQYDN